MIPTNNRFLQVIHRQDFYSLQELRSMGVSYIAINTRLMQQAQDTIYQKNDLMYAPHRKLLEMYDSVTNSDQLELIREISGVGGAIRLYKFISSGQ